MAVGQVEGIVSQGPCDAQIHEGFMGWYIKLCYYASFNLIDV